MELTNEDKSTIWYIIGKIDGIIGAGRSFEGEEIKALLMPIRDDLSKIVVDECF